MLFRVKLRLEKPSQFLAARASRDIEHGHFHVPRPRIMAELRHRGTTDRSNVEFPLHILLRQLSRRNGLRSKYHAVRPRKENRLAHLHQYGKRVNELLSTLILDYFSYDYSLQGIVGNLDQSLFHRFVRVAVGARLRGFLRKSRPGIQPCLNVTPLPPDGYFHCIALAPSLWHTTRHAPVSRHPSVL